MYRCSLYSAIPMVTLRKQYFSKRVSSSGIMRSVQARPPATALGRGRLESRRRAPRIRRYRAPLPVINVKIVRPRI